MPKVVMYTSGWCPYCVRARRLLRQKGVDYTEVSVEGDEARWNEMVVKSNRETVPQIFIDGKHVGGFDDLKALDDAKKLDSILRKS